MESTTGLTKVTGSVHIYPVACGIYFTSPGPGIDTRAGRRDQRLLVVVSHPKDTEIHNILCREPGFYTRFPARELNPGGPRDKRAS